MASSSHRRRWTQFSLRSLLLLMLSAGLFFGWVERQRTWYAEQRAALDRATELGGDFVVHAKGPRWLRALIGKDYVDVVAVSFDARRTYSSGDLQDDDLRLLRNMLELERLSLFGCTQITDAGLGHLAALTQLRRLSLHGAQVTDAGLIHIEPMRRLEALSLERTRVSHAGAKRLRALRSLRELSLAHTTAAGPIEITGFRQLAKLHLNGIGDVTALRLADLPKLKEVHLDGWPATSLRLERLPELTKLSVGFASGLGNDCEAQLLDLPKLKELRLQAQLSRLVLHNAPKLTILKIRSQTLPAADIANLTDLPLLEHLTVTGAADEQLRLSRFPRLKGLVLRSPKTGDAALSELNCLSQLEVVDLTGTAVTDATLLKLKQAGCRNLWALDLADTAITDAGLRHIAGYTELMSLNLMDTAVTAEGLAHLWDCLRLECLYLSRTGVDDSGLDQIGRFTNLTLLRLDGADITDAGLAHLHGLQKLGHIGLYDTPVTVKAVDQLNRAIPTALSAQMPNGYSYDNGFVDGQ